MFTDGAKIFVIAGARNITIWGKQNEEVGDITLSSRPACAGEQNLHLKIWTRRWVLLVLRYLNQGKFNFQIEALDTASHVGTIWYADEDSKGSLPVVPDEMATSQ
ncbi:hypothetical protein KCP78_11645 [Salmonella enterica subsp. enterica]|nr:hypothetical protein KCP78_11645 [Salmonella enterica subsp. enterica]